MIAVNNKNLIYALKVNRKICFERHRRSSLVLYKEFKLNIII
jgi:hypothetical protein